MGKQRNPRRFGFEAEFFGIERSDAVDILQCAGINAEDDGYHHETREYFRVTEDGSVSREANELVSPILYRPDDFRVASKALSVLSASGAAVDRSCGLHIHHDAYGMGIPDFARLVALWTTYQEAVNTLLPKSRSHASYARPLEDRRSWWERILSYDGAGGIRELYLDLYQDAIGRYHAVNLSSLPLHGTVEFRQHSGTLNGEKLRHWTILTAAFMRRATDNTLAPLDIESPGRALGPMFDTLRLPMETRMFYVKRALALATKPDDEGADADHPDDYGDDEDNDYDEDEDNGDPHGSAFCCDHCHVVHSVCTTHNGDPAFGDNACSHCSCVRPPYTVW